MKPESKPKAPKKLSPEDRIADIRGLIEKAQTQEEALNIHLGYKKNYLRGSLAVSLRWGTLLFLAELAEKALKKEV